MLSLGRQPFLGMSAISLTHRDGGGIRGLSSLFILERIMKAVNQKAGNNPPLKPCEYFDIICGTSTGGYLTKSTTFGSLQ